MEGAKNGAAWHVSGKGRESGMALATAQRRGGESGARCINDALLGYSIGLVARVHKFVYKSHRSSSEVTARINFALAATPRSPMRPKQQEDERHVPQSARARARENENIVANRLPCQCWSLWKWYLDRCSIVPNLYVNAFKFIFNFDDSRLLWLCLSPVAAYVEINVKFISLETRRRWVGNFKNGKNNIRRNSK